MKKIIKAFKENKKVKILVFVSIFLILALATKLSVDFFVDRHLEKTVKTLEYEKPSDKEEKEIYKKLYKEEILESLNPEDKVNPKVLDEIKKEADKNFDKFYKNIKKLSEMGQKNKDVKKDKVILLSQFGLNFSNEKLYKKILKQNELVEKKYGVNHKKFYYVYQEYIIGKREKKYLLNKYDPSEKEIEEYKKSFPYLVKTYRYNLTTVSNSKDAEKIIKKVRQGVSFDDAVKELKKSPIVEKKENKTKKEAKKNELVIENPQVKEDISTKRNDLFYEVPSYVASKWITSPERKYKDITYLYSDDEKTYYVIEFIKSFYDETPSSNVDSIFFSEKAEAQKVYNKLLRAKDLNKEFKKEAISHKQYNYNASEVYEEKELGEDFNKWLKSNHKENEIVLIETNRGDAIFKFNKRNHDKKYVNEIKKQLKEKYMFKVDNMK